MHRHASAGSPEYIQRGAELVTAAVQAERDHDFQKASDLYLAGAEVLLSGVKSDQANPRRVRAVGQKLAAYLAKAEQLRLKVVQQAADAAPPTHPAIAAEHDDQHEHEHSCEQDGAGHEAGHSQAAGTMLTHQPAGNGPQAQAGKMVPGPEVAELLAEAMEELKEEQEEEEEDRRSLESHKSQEPRSKGGKQRQESESDKGEAENTPNESSSGPGSVITVTDDGDEDKTESSDAAEALKSAAQQEQDLEQEQKEAEETLEAAARMIAAATSATQQLDQDGDDDGEDEHEDSGSSSGSGPSAEELAGKLAAAEQIVDEDDAATLAAAARLVAGAQRSQHSQAAARDDESHEHKHKHSLNTSRPASSKEDDAVSDAEVAQTLASVLAEPDEAEAELASYLDTSATSTSPASSASAAAAAARPMQQCPEHGPTTKHASTTSHKRPYRSPTTQPHQAPRPHTAATVKPASPRPTEQKLAPINPAQPHNAATAKPASPQPTAAEQKPAPANPAGLTQNPLDDYQALEQEYNSLDKDIKSDIAHMEKTFRAAMAKLQSIGP